MWAGQFYSRGAYTILRYSKRKVTVLRLKKKKRRKHDYGAIQVLFPPPASTSHVAVKAARARSIVKANSLNFFFLSGSQNFQLFAKSLSGRLRLIQRRYGRI